MKREKERTVTTHLVPTTRGQDEGPGADYLAYIPSMCKVTKGIVKDNKDNSKWWKPIRDQGKRIRNPESVTIV